MDRVKNISSFLLDRKLLFPLKFLFSLDFSVVYLLVEN